MILPRFWKSPYLKRNNDKGSRENGRMLLPNAKNLSENIRKLKLHLYSTASQKGIVSEEVLMISQTLDKEIVALQKILFEETQQH